MNNESSRHNKKSNKGIDLRSFIPNISPEDLQPQAAGKKTLATVIGEIVWLFTQSPLHRHLKIADLEWALMPALLLDQYKIYRSGEQVVAVALWGYLSKASEQKILKGEKLLPQDWGNNATFDPEEGLIPNSGGQLWLLELITPFEIDGMKHQEEIVNDLLAHEFRGKICRSLDINPETGEKCFKDVAGGDI